MRIGVISDTHGLLRPEAAERLGGVDHIIHAGDIGGEHIVARLRRIAPVSAIRGNNDTDAWASGFPTDVRIELAGRTIFILHDVKELRETPATLGYDVVVSGHSQKPKIETKNGVLYLNPGSAGPRRFKLPITVAILNLGGGRIEPVIHDIV